jgi:hypothetical protein
MRGAAVSVAVAAPWAGGRLTQRNPLPPAGSQNRAMAKKFPIRPAHPERTCWGCDRYCAADAMICGNGTERTQHPIETFGEGWEHEGLDPLCPVADTAPDPT